ncbi:MAG: hypothetical protein ACK59M_11115 [Pseudomonadota bacterium]|jgi:hypothetical protein
MVDPKRHKSPAAADSVADEAGSLPLVPTVNFRELHRGKPATLATILDVSRSAVSKAIRDGRIAGPGTDGMLDLRAAVAAWARNTHPGRIRARALRSVNDELAELHRRVEAAESTASALRAALASERERARAVSYGLQDAAAVAVARLADDLADGCAGLAERHTAHRLREAAASGALAWLIDRAAVRAGLYARAGGEGGAE